MDAERFNKLPIWAKNHIRQLERENARLKELNEERGATPRPSNPISYNSGVLGGYIPIPERAAVTFVLDAETRKMIEISLSNDDGETVVQVRGVGIIGALAIHPKASNSITITVKR